MDRRAAQQRALFNTFRYCRRCGYRTPTTDASRCTECGLQNDPTTGQIFITTVDVLAAVYKVPRLLAATAVGACCVGFVVGGHSGFPFGLFVIAGWDEILRPGLELIDLSCYLWLASVACVGMSFCSRHAVAVQVLCTMCAVFALAVLATILALTWPPFILAALSWAPCLVASVSCFVVCARSRVFAVRHTSALEDSGL